MHLPYKSTNKLQYIHLYVVCTLFCLATVVTTSIVSLTETEKTKALSYQNRFCGQNRMCSKSNNTDDKDCRLCPGCKCDDLCDTYGDCCADKTLEHISTPNFNPSRYRCHSNAFKLIYDKKDKFAFHSIQKCSLRDDEEVVELCENPNSDNITLAIPAQAKHALYRNQFCAKCNGETSFTLWAIKAECTHLIWLKPGMTSLQMIMSYVNNPGCAIFLHPPSSKSYRECYIPENEIVSTCNVSKSWRNYDNSTENLCLAYSSPIHLFDKVYRNIFCYICNHGVLDDNYISAPSCPFDTEYPFSVMLDPHAIETTYDPTTLSCECDPGHIYDNYADECLRLECTADRILREESCFSVIRSAKGLVYLLEVMLKPQSDLYVNGAIGSWIDSTARQLKAYILSQLGDGGVAVGLFRVQVHASDTKIVSITIHTKMKVVWEKEVDVLESTLIGLRESIWNVSLDGIGSYEVFQAEPHWTDPEMKQMYPVLITEAIDDNNTKYTMDHGFTIDLTTNFSALFVSKTLKCPRVNVKLGVNYEYGDDSNSFFHAGSNKTIDISQFEPSSSFSGFMCYSVFNQTGITCEKAELLTPTIVKPPFLKYISLAFQALSMLCLFLAFIVYLVFKKLRTLQGQNRMGLIYTMLVTVTLYTFGKDRVEFQLTCTVIGLLTHFFLLSSASWTFICTLHVYTRVKNVLKGKQPEPRSPNKRYALYFFLTLFVPGMILGTTVGVNVGLSDSRDLGYGGTLCYLSNFYSIVVATGAPLTISIVLNISLYIATVALFRGKAKIEKDLERSRNAISTYVKISIFTGVVWSFALASIFIDYDALKYVFVILCGLLGLFIFVSFVCTRFVLDLFRECSKGRTLYKSGDTFTDEFRMTYREKNSEADDFAVSIEDDYASITCVKDIDDYASIACVNKVNDYEIACAKDGAFDTNDLSSKLEFKDEVDSCSLKGNMNHKNITEDMLSKHISDNDSAQTVSTSAIDNEESSGGGKLNTDHFDSDHYGLLAEAVTKEIRDPYSVMFNPVFK